MYNHLTYTQYIKIFMKNTDIKEIVENYKSEKLDIVEKKYLFNNNKVLKEYENFLKNVHMKA